MHDVHRDSLLYQGTNKKIKNSAQKHDHEEQRAGDEHAHEHGSHGHHEHNHQGHHHDEHNHDDGQEQHDHGQKIPHGHEHKHDDAAYEEHEADAHLHSHEHAAPEDRAFTHVHDHGHNFYHGHFHTHHPEHTTVMHRMFGNPARDWFAAGLMGVLIAAGYFKMLPGHLSDGMLVCAAVIGLFPLLKNAVFDCIAKRALSADIIFGVVLLGGLIAGYFFAVAVISLCLLAGSFLRLDFSWKKE